MNSFLRDLRLGVRTALRSPGYSIVAVVTMALAIGANTLLFSLASPLVVRPLPIANADSLGWIRQVNGPRSISRTAAHPCPTFSTGVSRPDRFPLLLHAKAPAALWWVMAMLAAST